GSSDVCSSDLVLHELRVQIAAHGPVVVEVGGRGGVHPHLAGIDLLLLDQLVPDGGIQHARIYPAGFDPGDGGIMGAGEADAAEVLVRIDTVLHEEIAGHQVAGGGRNRTEGEALALQVLV